VKVISKSDKPIPVEEATDSGIGPTTTVGEDYAAETPSVLGDYAQLFKSRVTSMLLVCTLAGYYYATVRMGLPFFTPTLFLTLLGVGLTACGAAAINEAMEVDTDARMSRTKMRPLPAGRMKLPEAVAAAVLTTLAGTAILAHFANPLTGLLALSTVVLYAFGYTPLKKITPWSTFVGAFPGAAPPVLGWTAVRGTLDWEAFALFAIMFFWQFPHFLAIAWLFRDDYDRAKIKMLPVVDKSGRKTIFQILAYGTMLIPVSLAPFVLRMGGIGYGIAAVVLGIGYLAFGVRLALLRLPPMAAHSKKQARQLLTASIVYLPMLFLALALNGGK